MLFDGLLCVVTYRTLQASGPQIDIDPILAALNISNALAFAVTPSEKHSVVLTSFPGEAPAAAASALDIAERTERKYTGEIPFARDSERSF